VGVAFEVVPVTNAYLNTTPLHILLFEHPSQRAFVVSEQFPDALVAHLLVGELLTEEFVLLANLGFVAHTGTCGATPL
jgi:hypothetical protein